MHPADELALRIALEEGRQGSIESRDGAAEGEVPELVVIERRDFTSGSAFNVKEPGRAFPIDGPGTLDSLLIIADDDDFDIYLAIDGQTLVDDSFASLSAISSELNRISAYDGAPGYVFAATDYEFFDRVEAVIQPQTTITFRRQRAEVDLIREL